MTTLKKLAEAGGFVLGFSMVVVATVGVAVVAIPATAIAFAVRKVSDAVNPRCYRCGRSLRDDPVTLWCECDPENVEAVIAKEDVGAFVVDAVDDDSGYPLIALGDSRSSFPPRMWVIERGQWGIDIDRCESPSGIGYGVEFAPTGLPTEIASEKIDPAYLPDCDFTVTVYVHDATGDGAIGLRVFDADVRTKSTLSSCIERGSEGSFTLAATITRAMVGRYGVRVSVFRDGLAGFVLDKIVFNPPLKAPPAP